MKNLFLSLSLAVLALNAYADIGFRNWEDPDKPQWAEKDFKLPPFPKEADLVEFYVSAVATSKFYIDASSLTPGGEDGVVRYVMVVKTAGGATNISYEGIRCEVLQMRVYALGRTDGTWSESRMKDWKPVLARTLNQQQGALARDYLCPNSIPIFTADEGRNALRQGKHPSVQ